MKIGTRMTSAALLVSLLAAGLLSCADADAGTQETQQTTPIETEPVTEAVTEDPALRDSLPEVDLGGYQYRMAIFGTDIQRIMTYNDDEDGNVVNDAVYHKIRTVEERFNTDIVLADISYLEEDQIAALKKVEALQTLAKGTWPILMEETVKGKFLTPLKSHTLEGGWTYKGMPSWKLE